MYDKNCHLTKIIDENLAKAKNQQQVIFLTIVNLSLLLSSTDGSFLASKALQTSKAIATARRKKAQASGR